MNPIDLREVFEALWPALPIIALFASLVIGCLITRNYAAPRFRRRRLQGRLEDLADCREGKHLLRTAVLVPKARPVVSEEGRVAAHIGVCLARAERLVVHLEQAGVDESLVDEARRLHRHLVGLHTTTTEVN